LSPRTFPPLFVHPLLSAPPQNQSAREPYLFPPITILMPSSSAFRFSKAPLCDGRLSFPFPPSLVVLSAVRPSPRATPPPSSRIALVAFRAGYLFVCCVVCSRLLVVVLFFSTYFPFYCLENSCKVNDFDPPAILPSPLPVLVLLLHVPCRATPFHGSS